MTQQPNPYGEPQPPIPYGQPTYPYAAPPARPTSGLAVAAMVTGIAGFVLCFFVLPSIAAVVLGHMALKDTADGSKAGRGQAITGLALGYVVVAGVCLYLTLSILGYGISTFNY
jgi:hypothetical protein